LLRTPKKYFEIPPFLYSIILNKFIFESFEIKKKRCAHRKGEITENTITNLYMKRKEIKYNRLQNYASI